MGGTSAGAGRRQERRIPLGGKADLITDDFQLVVAVRNETRNVASWVRVFVIEDAAPPEPGEVGDTGFDGDPATTERVDTPDPKVAALAISQGRFADAGAFAQAGRQAAHAVLSRDDVFADSLAGAPLVGDGPIFFVDPAQLDAAGYDVVRLDGPSRVETSVRVAQEVRALYPGGQVALARAGGPQDNPTAAWADSITGGAWAAFQQVPIVVTPSEELHPAVGACLAADGPEETILLGGTAALSPSVEQAVPNPRRVAGPSRDETAVRIAQTLWNQVSTGERSYVMFNAFEEAGWMFGLGAAGVSRDAQAPLLPLNPAGPSDAIAGLVSKTSPDGPAEVDTLLMGDDSVLPEALEAELDELD